MKYLETFKYNTAVNKKLWTALKRKNFWDFVELLKISNTEDVEGVNDGGDTLLIHTAYTAQIDFMLQLIKHNANVYVKSGTGLFFIELVKKLISDKYYKKIYRTVLKHNKNFNENMKILKETDKYNL